VEPIPPAIAPDSKEVIFPVVAYELCSVHAVVLGKESFADGFQRIQEHSGGGPTIESGLVALTNAQQSPDSYG